MSETPEWIDKTPKEIEELIVELADDDKSPSEIGVKLRDQYGIKDVREVLDESILEVLQEHEMAPRFPEELMNLMKKAVQLRDHMERHPQDLRSKRSLKTLESRIHKRTKYYRRKERIPEGWRYEPDEAALLVRG